MSGPVVTLSGVPGSGKTTAGRRVAEALALEFVSAGELFRRAAAERGVDLLEFSRLAERDERIDRDLDDRMLRLATPGRFLEGRVTGSLCRRRGIACITLALTAREDVRVERLSQRDGTDLRTTRNLLDERERLERERYLRYYGIDLAREPADLTVDSSDLGVDAVVGEIVRFLKSYPAETSR